VEEGGHPLLRLGLAMSSETDIPPPPPAPHFEDLRVGWCERSAPSVTLSDGMAAVHQAILGDRLRLALDRKLARDLLGLRGPLAHPALVWDVAIGQSTLLTARVIANLFYRGLVLLRAPVIGDTLSTSTEVVALQRNVPRADRPASGLVVLRVRTEDQEGREVLDFWRCAMLPLRDPEADDNPGPDLGPEARSGHTDSFDAIPAELDPIALRAATAGWNLHDFPGRRGAGLAGLRPGARWSVLGGDVVSGAPELARLTLNEAAVHRDRRCSLDGRRLVYGGHTIGLAAAQATRALPEIVTIVGWHSCEHLAPVHEGDTLRSELELERLEPLDNGGALAHLRSRVLADADGDGHGEGIAVLDWRFAAVLA
jgi:acyl dehydratase